MKLRNVLFIIWLVAFELLSCNEPARNKEPNSFQTATKGMELDTRLAAADSLVFVFYKDPYSSDSLRYTRFYAQYATTDSNDIKLLLQTLDVPFIKQEKVKKCRSEGKIWCYAKGKIFQTVYFSTRCDDCCFTYLIKDGYFFYMKLDDSLVNRLAVLKPRSKEI